MRANWDGIPDAPESSGWHWVEDVSGLRPLLWRGTDWPDVADRGEWEDGPVLLSPLDLQEANYLGPVETPPSVMERFRQTRLAPRTPRWKPGRGFGLGVQ